MGEDTEDKGPDDEGSDVGPLGLDRHLREGLDSSEC